ncbi:Nn.00g098070.m01.CDS01 [Neocucurbitaria sp. VM-36]
MRLQMEADNQRLLDIASNGNMPTPAVQLEERRRPTPTVTFADPTRSTSCPRPSYKISWFQRLQETWILELLGLLCSASGLIIIVAILLRYDGKQRPTWYISINAVISILSAIVSIGALYSVTHGVSQLKWVWLSEKERKLADIQAFDSGSRGVLGAMTLLLHLRARHLAALGAVAIILRVGIDPFIQNVIHFENGVKVDETQASYAARTLIYQDAGPMIANAAYGPNPALKGSLYSAIYGNPRSNILQPQYLCPTGNCTWDSFASFAFCPKCIDVSEHLNRTCKNMADTPPIIQICNVTFPSGAPYLAYDASLDYLPAGMPDTYFITELARSSIVLNTTGSMHEISFNPFIWHSIRADVSAAVVNDLNGLKKLRNDTGMIGTECAMFPCILSIDADVSDGIYQERILDTYYFPDDAINYTIATSWGKENGVRSGDIFGMTFDAYQSAVVSLLPPLVGEVQEADAGMGVSFSSDEIQAIFSAEHTEKTCDTPHDNFACTFKAIGDAMTKTVRDVSMPMNGSRMPDVVRGKAFVTTTFLRVEWMWLSLPVVVWVFGLIIWLGTMWKSWRVAAPLWRDNVLPLVFISPENKDTIAPDKLGSSSTAFTIRAEQMKVRLVDSSGHVMLVKS